MDIKDFDFHLPDDLIAQYPADKRDLSRLMLVDRADGVVSHRVFHDIKDMLVSGDVLVLNDTKVMQARVTGTKATGGAVELLLVEKTGKGADEWLCMGRASKGFNAGMKVFFDGGAFAEIVQAGSDGFLTARFSAPAERIMEKFGSVPLPPYIRRLPEAIDKARYQTVFAECQGAVAAPTAGLHFTPELLSEVKNKGVDVRFVTLHTGPGTFMPVRVADITGHKMLSEFYSIPPNTFQAVRVAKAEKRRVIAVGTTTARSLEAAVVNGFDNARLEGKTDLFIYPGFEFKALDGLLTNFHLPGSTLIMLTAAFGGHENIMSAYRTAVKEKYRFFSYGDAMLII
ncbi:tRNA preQ1(34) S-adenosylmethionine ribosyltransferase-isomerase QueA [bacterium]|nr:MAG: tRNA preQ1(34) S-adenosylmethionine ribosyltransferase-isomerase QueA [bacterium]